MRMRRALAFFARLVSPGYGTCQHCGMPWNWTSPHITNFTESSGCFPLCDHCWARLSIPERVPHYASLWLRWLQHGRNGDGYEFVRILSAVLQGK